MTVKQLIDLLKGLDPKAQIDLASDEEGNSFGDISDSFGEGLRLDGTNSYTLYPENSMMAEDRYKI